MRPKGVMGLAVVLVLFGILAYLLSDRFIERGLEQAGQSVVGAKVEIDNLEFSLLGLSISLDRLQVTNPNDTWKNLFETGKVSFDMELAPLARKKIIINDVTVAGIRIGTKRATDGRIPKPPASSTRQSPGWVEKSRQSLTRQIASAPVLNLGSLKQKINVDSLIALADIQSIARIDQFKLQTDSTYKKWDADLKAFNIKEKLKPVQQRVQELTSQKISGLQDLVATLDKSNKLYKDLTVLKKEVEAKKNGATRDFKDLRGNFRLLDDWIAQDFDALKSKAQLGDFTPQNVGKMLFGKALTLPTLGLLKYVGLARKYMPVAQKFTSAGKVEKPPRSEGQDIHFPVTDSKPDFLIEHVLVSGATHEADSSKALSLSGEINGITSDPHVYGKPLTFDLRAQLPQPQAFALTGSFDHTSNIAEDRVRVQASGIRIGAIELPQQHYMPEKIDINRGDVAADFKLIGDYLDFKLQLNARPVSFAFVDSLPGNDIVAKVTRSVFDEIDNLKIAAGIEGPVERPGLKISSNIDNVLARRIKGVIGESVQQAQAELRQRFQAIVGPRKQEALALLNNRGDQIRSELARYEKLIDDKLAVVNDKKKEMEAKIAKEKKKGLESVTKKLGGLFKGKKKEEDKDNNNF